MNKKLKIKALAQQRICVEYSIGGMKHCRILVNRKVLRQFW